MSTIDQIRRGLGRALETVTEGWQHLVERAGSALTWFNPSHPGTEMDTVEDQIVRKGSRWGLIPAEVEEHDREVVVRLEVPGMEPNEFDVSVAGDSLIVRGEKRVQHEERHGHYHVMECAYGQFERAIGLPAPVHGEDAKAKYRRGVLTVTIPKSGHSHSRRIQVETE